MKASSVTKPMSTHSNGSTTFELTDASTRYFICGIPRHCRNGTMHVTITTVHYDASKAAASPAPLQSTPADSVAALPAADAEGKSPAGAPSNAARYQQPATAVTGLAFAALAALVA